MRNQVMALATGLVLMAGSGCTGAAHRVSAKVAQVSPSTVGSSESSASPTTSPAGPGRSASPAVLDAARLSGTAGWVLIRNKVMRTDDGGFSWRSTPVPDVGEFGVF